MDEKVDRVVVDNGNGNEPPQNLARAASALQIVATLGILGIMLWVALNPSISYAPTPRIILFLLAAFLPAVLIGAGATTQLRLALPGFTFVTFGSAALVFATLWLLTYLSKPDKQIGVYSIYSENGDAVDLNWNGAVKFPLPPSGIQVTYFVRGNQLIVIFPEQVVEQMIEVKTSSSGPVYRGLLTYSGSVDSEIELGKQLRTRNQSAKE